jgi:hypothetical protein
MKTIKSGTYTVKTRYKYSKPYNIYCHLFDSWKGIVFKKKRNNILDTLSTIRYIENTQELYKNAFSFYYHFDLSINERFLGYSSEYEKHNSKYLLCFSFSSNNDE